VTTYVSNWKNKNENGFIIWNCRAKKICSLNKDPFFQFLWRPKPPAVLSPAELDNLNQPATFKKYQKKYKLLEKSEQDAVNSKRKQEQDKLKGDYRALLIQRLKDQETDIAWKKSMNIHDAADSDFYVVEECTEEILEEKIDVIET